MANHVDVEVDKSVFDILILGNQYWEGGTGEELVRQWQGKADGILFRRAGSSVSNKLRETL